MNEIKRKKVVKVMPGKDYESQEYKAYDLQNTILIGKMGSGVLNELNNIILNLAQEYSPKELGIQYISTTDPDSPWLNENRKLPHMDVQIYCDYETECNYDTFVKETVNCIYSAYGRMSESLCEESDDEIVYGRQHVIVLNVDGKTLRNDSAFNAIKYLLHYTSVNETGCKVFLVTQDMSDKVCELEEYFNLRLLTRTTEEISNRFLGCNLSHLEQDITGFVWVTEKNNPYIKRKLMVPFKPQSLYNKLCKYLSNKELNTVDVFYLNWKEIHADDFRMHLSFFIANIRCKIKDDYRYGKELMNYLDTLSSEELYLEFLHMYGKYISVV